MLQNPTIIDYTKGKFFKITIAHDGQLRLKIPSVLRGKPRDTEWQTRCLSIHYYYNQMPLSEQVTVSLRGKVKCVDDMLIMYNKHNKRVLKVEDWKDKPIRVGEGFSNANC